MSRRLVMRAISAFFAHGAISMIPLAAHASQVYVDLGGGVSMIRNQQPFFPQATQSLGMGAAFAASVAWDFTSARAPIHVHILAQHRMSSGTDGSNFFALQATYPALRIQIWKFYFTGGATPLIWKPTDESGRDKIKYKMTQESLAYLGEAGIEIPIVPVVSFTLAASMEMVSTSGVTSPKPIIGGVASFRFYFRPASYMSQGKHDRDYDGWRYPYGIPKF